MFQGLGTALTTPSTPGAPLLADASSRWVRLLPYVVALAFVASLLPTTVHLLAGDYGVNGALAGAIGTAQTAPLLLAVVRPLQAWWIIFAADVLGALVMLGADGTRAHLWPWTPPAVVGYCALMVALGLRESRRALFGVWLATGVAGYALEAFRPAGYTSVHTLLLVLSGVLLLLTSAVRARGDAQRRLVEQETISEAERARRTLLEERARIARELHDVVAHHMSVITVQADSAPYRIPELPDAAREEFTSIAASARESLAEMRRLLSVLRSDGSEGERAPQPGARPGPAARRGDGTGGGAGRAAARRRPRGRIAGGGPVRVPDRAGGPRERRPARAGGVDPGVDPGGRGMADDPRRQRAHRGGAFRGRAGRVRYRARARRHAGARTVDGRLARHRATAGRRLPGRRAAAADAGAGPGRRDGTPGTDTGPGPGPGPDAAPPSPPNPNPNPTVKDSE